MADTKTKEILGGKENELKKKFEQDGYNWKEIKEKLEQISQKEQIDRKLTELEGDVDAYYDYLKGLIEAHKKNEEEKSKKSLVEKAKDKVKTEIAEKKAEFKKTLIEETKKIPLFGGFLSKLLNKSLKWIEESEIEKPDDGFKEKVKKGFFGLIGLGIASLFGYGKYKKELEEACEKIRDGALGVVGEVGKIGAAIKDGAVGKVEKAKGKAGEEVKDLKAQKEKVKEEIIDVKYKGGFKLILALSGQKIDDTISTEPISKGLSGIIYKDFLEKKDQISFRNEVLGINKENESTQESEKLIKQYENVKKSFSSEKTGNLLRIGLSANIVENILMGRKKDKPNEGIKKVLGEVRFNEILTMSRGEKFDYKNLSIYELSVLNLYTIPVFTSGALLLVEKQFSDGIHDLMGNGNEIKTVLEESKENIFNPTLIDKLKSDKTEIMGKSEAEMIKKLGLTETKDLEDFSKLYEFKTYIMSPDFLDDKKVLLGEEQKKLLVEKLDYRKILILYSVMGGNHLNELSSFNIPILVWTLSKIMSFSNIATDSLVSANYLKNFAVKSLLPQDGEEVFSEDEKLIIGVYKDKLMDTLILSYFKKYLVYLGIATDKAGIMETALIAGTSGIALRYVGLKGTTKALNAGKMPFLSGFIKKAGWVGIIGGLALGGLTMLGDGEGDSGTGKFDKDLGDAYNNKDVKKVIEILEARDKGIQKFEKDGKEGFLISYEGSSPYIILDKKIYKLSILGDSSIIENFTFGFLKKDTSIEGKDINKFRIEGENLVLGNNVLKIPLIDFINSNWEKETINEDFISELDSGIKKVIPDITTSLGKGKKADVLVIGGYLKENGLKLGLYPVGDLEVENIDVGNK